MERNFKSLAFPKRCRAFIFSGKDREGGYGQMNTKLAITILTICLTVLLGINTARAINLDFEGLPDSTPLTTQYGSRGVSFSNATVITAGITLNEFEFPPHSGSNIIFDDAGPITLTFTMPISQFGAYFTYFAPLSLSF